MMVVQLAVVMMRGRNIRHIHLLQVIVIIFAFAQISIILLGVIEEFSHGIFLLLLIVSFLRLFLFVLFSCHSI